jgi:hypothetical protein
LLSDTRNFDVNLTNKDWRSVNPAIIATASHLSHFESHLPTLPQSIRFVRYVRVRLSIEMLVWAQLTNLSLHFVRLSSWKHENRMAQIQPILRYREAWLLVWLYGHWVGYCRWEIGRSQPWKGHQCRVASPPTPKTQEKEIKETYLSADSHPFQEFSCHLTRKSTKNPLEQRHWEIPIRHYPEYKGANREHTRHFNQQVAALRVSRTAVSIATTLPAPQLRNRDSISGRCKRLPSS